MARRGGDRFGPTLRQLEREALRCRRELERRAKETAKLSALEQARLEVETFENVVDVLMSVHKEPREQWDWLALAAALPDRTPVADTVVETSARRDALLNGLTGNQADAVIAQARESDVEIYRAAVEEHAACVARIEAMRRLAERVLDGEGIAYLEAFAEFNPVAEFSSAGSLRQFAVERRDLIDCAFKIELEDVIPADVKTLTAGGKLSVKPMPKARRHELYQDYVSSCTLRMAGEVFAMLPVDTVIVTAWANASPDTPRAAPNDIPILTTVFDRAGFDTLDFQTISPADALDLFRHRCNFKVTRGSGRFEPVMPFSAPELTPATQGRPTFDQLMTLARELREEIRPAAIARATSQHNGDD